MINETTFSQIKSEIDFSYARSSGPGGQNVNKTSTKAELRWKYLESAALSFEQKNLITLKAASQITKNNEILIQTDTFRDRLQNQSEGLEKLRELINRCLVVPKKRKKTKPTRGSIERRLSSKKRNSEKKQNRIRL